MEKFLKASKIHNVKMFFDALKSWAMTYKLLEALLCVKAKNSLKAFLLSNIKMN